MATLTGCHAAGVRGTPVEPEGPIESHRQLSSTYSSIRSLMEQAFNGPCLERVSTGSSSRYTTTVECHGRDGTSAKLRTEKGKQLIPVDMEYCLGGKRPCGMLLFKHIPSNTEKIREVREVMNQISGNNNSSGSRTFDQVLILLNREFNGRCEAHWHGFETTVKCKSSRGEAWLTAEGTSPVRPQSLEVYSNRGSSGKLFLRNTRSTEKMLSEVRSFLKSKLK